MRQPLNPSPQEHAARRHAGPIRTDPDQPGGYAAHHGRQHLSGGAQVRRRVSVSAISDLFSVDKVIPKIST